MAHRRTKGSGSIQRRRLRWYPIVNARDPVTGQRQRRSGGGFDTKIAAQAALNKMLAEGEEYRPTHGLTLRRLVDEYIEACEARNRAETTTQGYRILASRLDAIGDLGVQKLQPVQIDAFCARLLADGLSATTVSHTHGLLTASFRWAIRKGRLNVNPLLRVDTPRRKRPNVNPLQMDEVSTLLDAVAGHRLGAALIFSLASGMRRGEVAGLRWRSVDLHRSVIVVRESRAWANKKLTQKTTKTERVREIPIGKLARQALELARREARLRERLSDFVFTDEYGQALHPNALTDAFRRLANKLGLSTQRLHDLRHTAATLMLTSGSDLNTVQEILGHSAASTTANIYGHSLKGHKEQAIGTIDAALESTKRRRNVTKRTGA